MDRISDVHIKDRNYLGGPVPLGDGAVNFLPIMEYLQNNYTGICYQAYRDDEGIEIFKQRRYEGLPLMNSFAFIPARGGSKGIKVKT